MGICDTHSKSERNKNNEINNINNSSNDLIQKKYIIKSLCNIKILNKTFSGFFLKYNQDKKDFLCLIINGNLIPKEINGQTMTILFPYLDIKQKEILLNSNERLIKNFNDINIDVTLIQILPKDNTQNIYFLTPDMNYINDTDSLMNKNICISQGSMNNFDIATGKIVKINKNEFCFYKSDNEDSLGSPIFLNNSIQVIGMHKGVIQGQNYGIFIWPIINQLNNLIQIQPDNKNTVKIYDQKKNPNNFSQSYINAILQCFCNIKPFVDFFKKEKIDNDNQNEKLSKTFKTLIDNIYPDNSQEIKRTFTPINLEYKISHINPLFEDISTNKEKDLINFIIMTLHEELNECPNKNIIGESNYGNIFEEQKDKKIMFNNFINNFNKSHKSIISDLFFGINYNKYNCLNCQTITYNFQIYNYLFFSLDEIKNFKQKNEIDLLDCFDFAKKENMMTDENGMYCNYCKQISKNSMCNILYTSPEILIIILNQEKNIKINFNLNLNLMKYIEKNSTSCSYELIGVVSKNNNNEDKGDFIAYCKGYLNNQWIKFCDALSEQVKDVKSEVIDSSVPYLLFYKKIKN